MNICGRIKFLAWALVAMLANGGPARSEDLGPAQHSRLFQSVHVPVAGRGVEPNSAGPRATKLTIVPTFDVSITSDPRAPAIKATINSAIALYENTFSDPITVTITFRQMYSGLGSSLTYTGNFTYVQYRAALVSHASGTDDNTALAHLPSTTNNPANNDPGMIVPTALARALGFTGSEANPPSGETDCTIGLKISDMNVSSTDTDPAKYSMFATVCHEIDEALGTGSNLDGFDTTGPVYPEDLFRYMKSGARSYDTSSNTTAYFSLDGTADLAQYNQDGSGDFGDWYSINGGQVPQVQDAFASPGTNPVPNVEFRLLDVLGYTRAVTSGTANQIPVITSPAFCTPDPVRVGGKTTFTVGAADADNDTLTISWKFGDGGTGTGASVQHVYAAAGSYTATATIGDGKGGTAASSIFVSATVIEIGASSDKYKFKLNFKTAGADGIDVTFNSTDFKTAADGSTVIFVIGDPLTKGNVTVDQGTLSKNKAPGKTGRFTVNTHAGTVRYATTKNSLQAALAPYGATNATQKSTPIFVSVAVLYNGAYYTADIDFSYTAVNGKSGAGK